MKLNVFLLLWLTGLVPVSLFIIKTVPHNYELVMTLKSWTDAKTYCRAKFTDLATVESYTDWLRFKKESKSKGLATVAWVGLYDDISSWRWSLDSLPLKNVHYTNWYSGQPDNLYGKESCVVIGSTNNWWDCICSQLRPFICYNANFTGTGRFVGINSPLLAWDQAQTYCRTYHTDLASSLNSTDNDLLMRIRNIQGDSWIGLYRETWKWADGTNASTIQWAPGEPNNGGVIGNCGAIDKTLYRDVTCTNRNYFFCHTNFPTRSQILRLQMKSDESVFDPAVQSFILEQMKQKLVENGMLENTTVTWKVQPDGNIFHKKKKDHL